jgi:ABC-type phosphate transport system substrate-binding protein
LRRAPKFRYLSILLWVMSVLPLSHAYGEPQIQVIVNSSVSEQQLSTSQARWVFSMRQPTWPNGQAIKVYVLDSQNLTHSIFAKKILKVFPYQLERTWDQLAYSGLGDKPYTVKDEAQMIEKVSQQPGAIGYIVFKANKANNIGIHVIQIIKE